MVSPGTPVSSTNKSEHYGITEILLKIALNTLNQTLIQAWQYIKQINFKWKK